MKKSFFISGSILLLSAVTTFTACSGTFTDQNELAGTKDRETVSDTSSVYCISTLPREELSDAETAGILFMREEEKVARDVYTELYSKYPLRVFDNISKSEQRHMDAVKALIDRYDLKDPTEGNDYGQYTNTDLQTLYDKLINDGSAGEIEALKVGALIEEKDILDLQQELDENVDNRDITQVWTNLRKGSEAHLRAFVWNLKIRGVNYSPVMMKKDAFDKIINRN